MVTTNVNMVKYCNIHPTRPLELICIDHKTKICTNCELSDEHKNHHIINEEDFMKEIEAKIETLIELFKLVDNNLHAFKNTNDCDAPPSEIFFAIENILQKSREKQSSLIKQLKSFNEEVIKNLKIKEGKMIQEINANFEKINTKILTFKEIPKDLLNKSDWKSNVQNKLNMINEITESNNLSEEFIKLLDMYINQDIINNAEEVVSESVKLKNPTSGNFENMIENNFLEINYRYANRLSANSMEFHSKDTKIDIEEILTLDENDNKIPDNVFNTEDNTVNINSFLNIGEDSAKIKINY